MGHRSFVVVSAECMDPSLGVLGFAEAPLPQDDSVSGANAVIRQLMRR